jgi:ankyrin repeat protein
MKKRVVFGMMLIALFVLGAQTVFASDLDDFRNALNRNNLRDIENLLSRRARQMDLAWCMRQTIIAPNEFFNTTNFNRANCLDVLKLLIRYGADVNRNFRTNLDWEYPLELAVGQQPLAVIQFLLDSGADPNLSHIKATGDRSNPPLYYAYANDDIVVMNLLLDRGANGQLLLKYLSGGKPGDNQMIRQLISRGIQIRSTEGAQALRKAAEGDHLDTVKLLVENGVNVNARDDKGATAASIAYDKGNIEIYNYLKANGAIDFEPRQATAQPAAPASSTTNVYVTPPAPAQSGSSSSGASSSNSSSSSSSSSSPATPTLQNGRYAWANSGTNMTMTLGAGGIVSAYLNNSAVGIWQGTYRISGNQLVITVSNPTSQYSSLRGTTYTYTITSATSFSGSGETWVRTGSF